MYKKLIKRTEEFISEKSLLKFNGKIGSNNQILKFFDEYKNAQQLLVYIQELEEKLGTKFYPNKWPAAIYEEGTLYTEIASKCNGSKLNNYINYGKIGIFPPYTVDVKAIKVYFQMPLIWGHMTGENSIKEFLPKNSKFDFDLLLSLNSDEIREIINNNQNEENIISFFKDEEMFKSISMPEDNLWNKIALINLTKDSKVVSRIEYENYSYTRLHIKVPTITGYRYTQDFGYENIPISFYNNNTKDIYIGELAWEPLKTVLRRLGYNPSDDMDDTDFLITCSIRDLNLIAYDI